ncbi:MAG: 2-hydroxyacyl-CoA dehydratase family protein [Desulfobacteraceae bacterium]|jgi:benzoyl-CoA reductase/2-hydroxyglutaryl-CoA dehydratase subunit BcrC/BadD/HgdB
MNASDNKQKKLVIRLEKGLDQEYKTQLNILKEREDYSSELGYFLDILTMQLNGPGVKNHYKRPVIGLYCIQVPLELIDAMGFQPVRLISGSLVMHKFSSGLLPVLACPFIKSCVGSFYRDNSVERECDAIVMPTTCDWNVKMEQMLPDNIPDFFTMELPHVKESEKGRRRWFEELMDFKDFLERKSGHRLRRKDLLHSIEKYNRAWALFNKLKEMRREGRLPGTWFILMANAFLVDRVESWTEHAEQVIEKYGHRENSMPGIFLAGAPVFYPYIKIPELIEESGMNISGDELCTSERITGSVVYDDASRFGLLTTLLQTDIILHVAARHTLTMIVD